ncbi:DEAD/DEAH box helicase [Staphylococcus saprophyticus]|uniref:DEAD/DEAH box helicase n=1 Tax=Staphylococcus saprophyticus TaxID=29385 RepID=UPI001D176891|nr:DEAD/DEAH box helicase [Staphylococcus saprophyticus]MCC4221701.1 DEAD/DEAH box helicase [Staphylococcus saprophyticus]
MIRVQMNHDEQLTLQTSENILNKIIGHRIYKLRIKRYVDYHTDSLVIFRKNIYYKEIHNVINQIKKLAEKLDVNVDVDTNVSQYVNKVNSYIDYKYTVGNDIKNDDLRFNEKYLEFQKTVDERLERQLRSKQMKDAFYLTMMQKSGNFSVPGSGKTSTVYGMYAYLNAISKVNRIIMIGPLNAFNSWINEYQSCFGNKKKLSYLNIKNLNSSNEKKMALKYESGNKELILLNYEVLSILENEIKNLITVDTLVVFDEVHRIKNPEGMRAGAALRITENAKYMVTLTGTPIPNGYKDIYNLLNLLYPYDYNNFFNFAIPLLDKPSHSEVQMINDKIQPFFTRTTKDELGVPPTNPDKIIDVAASFEEQKLFDIILSKYKSNQLALFAKIMQLESSPSLLLETLDLKEFEDMLDLSANHEDFVEYQDYSKDIEDLVDKIERPSKMNALLQLVDQIVSESKTAIVWCIFIRTMYKLKSDLNKMGIRAEVISGSVSQEERNEIINKFKSKEIDILITNPHTLAESVSLHQTCHDAIYFEYSYNLVHLLQSKDRIHRLGLDPNDYTQYYYLQQSYPMEQGNYSLGERIYKRLSEKEQLMLDAIDKHELEILPTEDEDLKFFFKKVIDE